MKIQFAHDQHLRDVCKLLEVLNTEKRTFSDKKQNLFFITKQWCYIAVERGKIEGVMVLEPTDGSYKIHTLVSKQKGLGTLLVNWAIDICRKNNIPKLWCWSFTQYAAEGFYKKMGYKVIGRNKGDSESDYMEVFGKVLLEK